MNTTTPSTPSSTKLSVNPCDLESAIEAAFEYGKTYTMEVLTYMDDDLVSSRLYNKIDTAVETEMSHNGGCLNDCFEIATGIHEKVRKLEAEVCKAQATADALRAQVKSYKEVGGGPWSE